MPGPRHSQARVGNLRQPRGGIAVDNTTGLQRATPPPTTRLQITLKKGRGQGNITNNLYPSGSQGQRRRRRATAAGQLTSLKRTARGNYVFLFLDVNSIRPIAPHLGFFSAFSSKNMKNINDQVPPGCVYYTNSFRGGGKMPSSGVQKKSFKMPSHG